MTNMEKSECLKDYVFKNGLHIMCRQNSCMFCENCTDIYFDSCGPYAVACINKDFDAFKNGMLGNCKFFCKRSDKNGIQM